MENNRKPVMPPGFPAAQWHTEKDDTKPAPLPWRIDGKEHFVPTPRLYNIGLRGEKGEKGEDGNGGRGITSIDVQADGTLVITYSDGTTQVIDVSAESFNAERMEKVLLYYGYPSQITDEGTVADAVRVYSDYDICVFGDQYELADNEDHENTVAIFAALKTNYPNVRLVGYVPIGVQNVSEDSNLTIAQIKSRIDAWRTMGADGIFLDEFGYDYGVSRERQNECVSYCHTNDLFVIANAWEIADAFSKEQKTVDDLEFNGNPNELAPQLGADDYYLYENLFFAVTRNALGQIVYDENEQMVVHASNNWRIDTINEYFHTHHTGESESWYGMYQTKLMSLDAIPSTYSDRLQAELRSTALIGASVLGIDAVALSDENWGAEGGYTDWQFPIDAYLIRNADKNVSVENKVVRWYTFTYSNNTVQFGTSGSVRVPSQSGTETVYTYHHCDKIADGQYSCTLFGSRKTLCVEYGEAGTATITIDGTGYTAATDPDATWEDEDYYLEYPYKWSVSHHGNTYTIIFDSQNPEESNFSAKTHYAAINGYRITNIWQTVYGIQTELEALAEEFEQISGELQDGIDHVDDIKDEFDEAYSGLSGLIEEALGDMGDAKDAMDDAADSMEAALQAVADAAYGLTFREVEW